MRTNCFFARRLFYDKTIRVDTKSDSDDEIFLLSLAGYWLKHGVDSHSQNCRG